MNLNFYDTLAELVDAATSDRELELITAAATAVAAPQLASDLRGVRDRARAAVRPKTMTDEEIVVRSVMDLGVAELITHATTNAEIDALVVAAEAGCGGPIYGLKEELTTLRDAEAAEWRVRVDAAKDQLLKKENERARRVFVGGAYGGPVSVSVPHIANLGEFDDTDFVEPGEAACRHAYGYHLPEPANVAPRIANLRETAEERRRIDAIKATIRVEDL